MNKERKTTGTEDNTLAHVDGNSKEQKPATYDPDRYKTTEGESGEGLPLEEQAPAKGYSTDPRQGKPAASLHLADEDMDKRPEDPKAKADDLQESFEKSKENSNLEKTKEELKEEQSRKS
jgi:hypothetical protein